MNRLLDLIFRVRMALRFDQSGIEYGGPGFVRSAVIRHTGPGVVLLPDTSAPADVLPRTAAVLPDLGRATAGEPRGTMRPERPASWCPTCGRVCGCERYR